MSRGTITIGDGKGNAIDIVAVINSINEDLKELQDEMINSVLLDSPKSVESIYNATADEYLELPGSVRL